MNSMFGLVLLLLLAGCSCPRTRTEASGSGDHPAGSPTAIKQNFTYIDGVIDSVIAVGGKPPQLVVTVTSARAGSGGTSMVETGTQLTVTPEITGDARVPDLFLHPRQGAKFSGSVSRALDGHWSLLDAESR